ncbi:MAG: YbaN family protein [Comamonas sp.]|nr:YbaN family protein [Comamonas sp.]
MRWLLRGFAVFCLGLGIAGVFIPGLPTTVFILMASWAAARSSPRLHAWLHQHRLFGPMLRNWEAGGYVSRRAKYSAAATMLLSALILWWLPGRPWWVPWLASTCMATVFVWLWLRPEPPEDGKITKNFSTAANSEKIRL